MNHATATTALRLHILGSGSRGNCALVEGPQGLIMIDDGFSRREVLSRMHDLGLDEADVRALMLTHEHSDHVSGVSVWGKRFDGPLYASAGTADARILPSGAMRLLSDARILALESNHDVPMLRTGSDPRHLLDRIISERGHLSNEQAADALRELAGDRTEPGVAMHISQENNRPSLAVRALAEALGADLDNELGSSATLTRGDGMPSLRIRAAGQNRPISIC